MTIDSERLDEHWFGEDAGDLRLPDFLERSLAAAEELNTLGHEVFSTIVDQNGAAFDIVHGKYVLETHVENGKFLMRHSKAIAAGTIVTGAAVALCAGAIRQRRAKK